MKTSTLALLASSITSSNALWKGFNLGAQLADGVTCKAESDWASDFATMKSLPGGPYNAARVYASSDCDTLANAVPAAVAAGIQIFAGVWTVDATHYADEKGALLAASQQYGVDWLAAISVGSESLYRDEQDAADLASQIYDVRGMMTTVPGGDTILVGHVDTWNSWVTNGSDAIVATDFLGTDGYPYFQNTEDNSIGNADSEFFASVQAVQAVAQGKPVWITETGWPTTGPNDGDAVPSVANAETYWKAVACSAFASFNTFWYILDDYNASLSFGVASGNTPKYDLTC